MRLPVPGICLTLLAATTLLAESPPIPALIPWPQKLELRPGEFHLTRDTRIFASYDSLSTAKQLAERLRPPTGYPLKVKWRFFSSAPAPNGIFLTTKKADASLDPEGYELTVASNAIVIRAPTQAGLFYGTRTLLQLLPPEVFSTNGAPDQSIAGGAHGVARPTWEIPCVQIEDWPRFRWRGFMLDVSRHFYTKAQVEKILDLMALYKLNTFHWHLTDDQGWRIQIKKYPRLTQVGAWRNSIGFGLKPGASTTYGPDGRYGGYYTQKDIREVVAYAARRHITIVPEIEMPAHSGAVLAAYPELGCSGKPFPMDSSGAIPTGVLNPANPETFTFLENVLREVFKLFPGQYVHIGGDEVPAGVWDKNPACEALMKREGLTNQTELQSWFTRRIAKFVVAHGKTPIGWSEIIKGGLPANMVLMDYAGGGKEGAEAGHDVVMTPMSYCYFDYYQSTNRAAEPKAAPWGNALTVRRVYSFEPIPANLPPQFQSHILGAQASLWTEFIASESEADYMTFPRLNALAEVVWTLQSARNWDDFQRRLAMDEQRLGELGVNYRRSKP